MKTYQTINEVPEKETLEQVRIKQEEIAEEVEFLLNAFQNEAPIRTNITGTEEEKGFLVGEQLIDTGYIEGETDEGETILTQHWTNGKVIQLLIKDNKVVDRAFLLENEELSTDKGRLCKIRELINDAIVLQERIEVLEKIDEMLADE